MKRRLRDARYSRRGVLAGGLAAGGGLAAWATAGCGDDDDDSTTSPTTGTTPTSTTPGGTATSSASAAPTTATAAPQRGGTIVHRNLGEPAHLDLHSATIVTGWPTTPVFNTLIRYAELAPEGKPEDIEADLAEDWEQVDPTTLVFTLRKGVQFHDGTELTSADVKAQLEWVLAPPEGKVANYGSLIRTVSAVETPDPYTVRLKLTRPSAALFLNLAAWVYGIGQATTILARGDVGDPPIGTGPFKWKSWERGVSMDLVRNENYFRSGLPYMDGIKWYILPDQESAKANFIAGQYDTYFASNRSPEDLDEIVNQMGNRAVTALRWSPGRTVLFKNTRSAPFNDVRVRQAIEMALDRNAAIQLLTAGKGRIGGYHTPVGPWAISQEELSKVPGYGAPNITDAKALLQQAGIADGASITIIAQTDAQGAAELIQQQLRPLGLDVKIDVVGSTATATFLGRMQQGQFELAIYAPGPVLDEPDGVFGDFATKGGNRNYGAFFDQEVEDLYLKQSQILNAEERLAAVNELEKKCLSLYFSPAVSWTLAVYAHNARVNNFVEHDGFYSGGRQHETTWLSS